MMRLLVACPDCARQFDATGRTVESRFRCLCGRLLTVPAATSHDAAVVRCSACGAPRQQQAAACGYCGADFTLHERDLHTICPTCMARVSDRARFCHHCATPLLPQPLGGASEHDCPACGKGIRLASRRLGEEPVSILECPRCAGIWLARAAFGLLLERARREPRPAADWPPPEAVTGGNQPGPLYRPCPDCGDLMHRRNYGRRSGVIVDSCARHGVWFDAHELDRLLRWVQGGGEAEASRRQAEEERLLARRRTAQPQLPAETPSIPGNSTASWLLDLLATLVKRLS